MQLTLKTTSNSGGFGPQTHSLGDLIKIWDDVLDPETCRNIIQMFESSKPFYEHHDTNSYKFTQLNLNNSPDAPLAAILVQSLIPYYEQYFEETGYKQYVNISDHEEVRIKKYRKGTDDQFKTHVDVTNAANAKRFLVSILYLNDNDGCTTFPTFNKVVEPKAGRLLVFPPLWMFPHNGMPPTNNDKYIMMSCLHYS